MPLLIPAISSQKYSSIVSYQAHSWQIQVFQNSPFQLKAWVWASATSTASCFLWSDRLTLIIFRKTSAKYPPEKPMICPSIVLPSKNGVAWKKGLVELATQAITQELFLEATTVLGWAAEALSVSLPLHHTKYSTMCIRGLRFNEINNFVALSKDILKKNWLCLFALPFYCENMVVKNTTAYITGGHCFDSCEGSSIFIHHGFCTISTTVNRVKKTNDALISWK